VLGNGLLLNLQDVSRVAQAPARAQICRDTFADLGRHPCQLTTGENEAPRL